MAENEENRPDIDDAGTAEGTVPRDARRDPAESRADDENPQWWKNEGNQPAEVT